MEIETDDRARRRTAPLLRGRGDIVLVVAAGGALGSVGRWALAQALPASPGAIPWGTWLANVSGALALGVLMVLVLDVWPPRRYLRPFLGVGVLGGYTTFSTYMLDTRTLLADGHGAAALAYLGGTLLAGLLAVVVGIVLARAGVRLAVSVSWRPGRVRRARGTDSHSDTHSDPTTRSTR